MALIQCPECGGNMSDHSPNCPHCGRPNGALNNAPCETEQSQAQAPQNQQGQCDDGNPSCCQQPSNSNRKTLRAVLVAAIAVLAVIAAYEGFTLYGANKQAKELREKEMADSMNRAKAAAESAAKAAEARQRDSLEWVNYSTPDLSFFEVHGHVKTLKIVNNGTVTFSFSNDGTLLTINGHDAFTVPNTEVYYDYVTYVKKGNKIVADQGWECGTEYTWDGDHVSFENGGAESMNWKTVYAYDANGRLERTTTYESEEGSDEPETKTVSTFSYLKDDMYGNWVERIRKNKNGQTTIKRVITYYEMEY